MSCCRLTILLVSNIMSHRRLARLGHLLGMPDERLPVIVLFGQMAGSGVRSRSQKQWVLGKFAGLSFTWWRTPRQGRLEWLPLHVSWNAPDLRIGRRIMIE